MKLLRRLLTLKFTLILAVVFSFSPAHAVRCGDLVGERLSENFVHESYEKLRTTDSWLKNHVFSFHHLKTLDSSLKELSKLDVKQTPELDNPRFNKILKSTVINPKQELTAEEIHFISANPTYLKTYKNVLRVLIAGEGLYRLTYRIGQYFEGQASAIQILGEKGVRAKVKNIFRGIFNGPLRFMVPVVYLPRINSKLDLIFQKQFKNPDYEPTAQETEILKQYKAEEAFKDKKDFMKSHGTWTNFRRWIGRVSLATVMAVNLVLVGTWAMHLAQPKSFVGSERFFDSQEYRLKANQVRIYNETVPFPHMAIEIDGRVYSYGQTHMTVKPTREYLLSEKINDAIREQSPAEAPGSSTLDRSLQLTGLNKVSRSVQMVTLNLTEKEKADLRRYLELQTGNTYRNFTLVMDCATMVVQALEKQTGVRIPGTQSLTIDASPSMVMMYLGVLKTVGAKNLEGRPLVENVMQIAMADQDQRDKHFYRGLYINAMEGKVFTHFFHYNMVFRQFLHAVHGAENFQFLQPEMRKEIESWHKMIVEDYRSGSNSTDAQLLVFVEEARKLGQTPVEQRDEVWERKRIRFVTVSTPFIQGVQNQARQTYESPDTTFSDIIRGGYRFHLYEGVEKQIQDLLAGKQAELNTGNPAEILRQIR